MTFRSKRVQSVLEDLEERLANRLHRPGDRFATARQIAEQYGISYQTAHRVLANLADQGLIERRPRSGSYIAGKTPRLTHVQLVMHDRAANPQGFGGKLQQYLTEALNQAAIPCTARHDAGTIDPKSLPVIWENPRAIERCVADQRPGIAINERPKPSWGSSLLDSIGTDDFAGGALAADTLMRASDFPRRFGILAGPANDRRSDERIAGFRSRVDAEFIHHADNWHRDAGRRAAQAFSETDLTGIFAANDRLAQGITLAFRDRKQVLPAIVGYDDAPIAGQLGLTTIALPWQEIADAVVQRAQLRLQGGLGPACTFLFQPSVVFHENRQRPSPV
ncbi:MAG: substrate-binding domain-containing protein [Planctomycetota bacterium]